MRGRAAGGASDSPVRDGTGAEAGFYHPTDGAAPADARLIAATVDPNANACLAFRHVFLWYTIHNITPAGVDSLLAGSVGNYGVQLGAPGSLAKVDAIAAGPDGTIYVTSANSVLGIVQ